MKKKMSDVEAQIERTKQQVAAMSDALQKAQASGGMPKVQMAGGGGGGGSATPIVRPISSSVQTIPPEPGEPFEWDSLMREAMRASQYRSFEHAQFLLDFAREVRLMDLQHAEKFEEIRKELKEE